MTDVDPFVRALTGDPSEQTITLVRRYAATMSDVWDAVTRPERVARWYGTIVGAAPRRPGDAFDVDLGGGMVRRAVLEGCDAPRALTYTWWSGDDDPGLVRLRLDPVGDGGTELTVTHDRLRPHRVLGYGGGWEQSLATLAATLGEHEGEQEHAADAGREARWELLRSNPLDLEWHVDAPLERVWRSWASAAALRAWWWNHWDDVAIEADVRVGGTYRIDAQSHGFTVSGTYLVVDPRRRLAFTWVWTDDDGVIRDEAVDVAFREESGGTTLVVRHTGPWEGSGPASSYREGWEFVLAELARAAAAAAR